MRRYLFLIVLACFWITGYAQDVYPLYRKYKTYKESAVAYRDEFGRSYSFYMKEFKKTDKDGFKRDIVDFKDVTIRLWIKPDGKVMLDDSKLNISQAQRRVIERALESMPDWTPWQHSIHNGKLGMTFPVVHSNHR